jgi:hypothetical protein
VHRPFGDAFADRKRRSTGGDDVIDGDDVLIKRFEEPDELRTFELGTFAVASLGGITVGRATYEPGWIWSEHVGKASGQASCRVAHVGLVVSGTAAVRMDDGTEYLLTPGDLFSVAPGHDSWVVGDEPYVSLHLMGAAEYAANER